MTTSHPRSLGLAAMLGALALLGGCVATGPVGYDDYPYGYGTPGGQVDVDVYSHPGYRNYPGGYPYYGPRYGYDPRWDGGYRRPPPRQQVVPVPVPYPVAPVYGGRPPRDWQQPDARPPRSYPIPPQARPGQAPARIVEGQRVPGLPSGSVLQTRPVPLGDQP
ncbi:MAG: hypothetical protein EOO29_17975 [Comamonadaceae bacterium]|nr:MAG: hypothetical protein EOO29_17975 [Comamonadaceae bacterium]